MSKSGGKPTRAEPLMKNKQHSRANRLSIRNWRKEKWTTFVCVKLYVGMFTETCYIASLLGLNNPTLLLTGISHAILREKRSNYGKFQINILKNWILNTKTVNFLHHTCVCVFVSQRELRKTVSNSKSIFHFMFPLSSINHQQSPLLVRPPQCLDLTWVNQPQSAVCEGGGVCVSLWLIITEKNWFAIFFYFIKWVIFKTIQNPLKRNSF